MLTLMLSDDVRSQVIVMVRYKGYLEVVELVMETASGCEKLPRMDMDESCESFNYQLSYKFNINLNDSVLYLLQLMNISTIPTIVVLR